MSLKVLSCFFKTPGLLKDCRDRLIPVFAKGMACLGLVLLLSSATTPGGEAKYIRRADVAFDLENFTLALELYKKALEINPESLKANYKAGYCYMELHEPKKAKVYFKKAFDIDASVSDYLILLYLAEAHHQDYEFEEARNYYQQEMVRTPRTDRPYIQFLQKRMDECVAGSILVNKASVVKVINLGPGINTPFSDYIPVFMPGDSTMLFTTRYTKTDRHGLQTDEEKLRYAKADAEYWKEVSPLFGEYKSKQGHGLVNIGPVGKKLYTFHETKGLHVSALQHNTWSEPESMGYPFDDGQLNVSLFITPDGKYAFFSSNREGGFGGLDLYVAAKQEDGTWGAALNLGPNVNTTFDDDAPFVDPETYTLYFSSLGHNNMGGFDIFSSKLTNGEWSPAQNLGYPINSTHDDLYFVLNRKRTSAFFSSNRAGGFGGKDIYQVILPGK